MPTTRTNATIALQRLIRPASLRDFREGDAWKVPQLARGPLRRFPELLAIPELTCLPALVAAYNDPIWVWLPARWVAGREDTELHGSLFYPESALRLHRLGATLFFHHVERYIPALARMNDRLERELGMVGSFRPSVVNFFASARGAAGPVHFDAEINLAVQLRGIKRWWVAPDASFVHPPSTYSVVASESAALRAAWTGARPQRMPPGSTPIDLDEGATLYVPPGWLHRTDTLEDSLHLVFSLWPKPWCRVLGDRIREKLAHDSVRARERERRAVDRVAGELEQMQASELVGRSRRRA